MKILVIGASGMLAKPVIRQLDRTGFQLRLLSRHVDSSMFEKEYDIIQGDVFDVDFLNKAMNGCDAVHISLSVNDEAKATAGIVEVGKQQKIKALSMISGCTVAEENRWFPMIDSKFRAEQLIINSGIPYMIFRPTWFFESLGLMVRNGKASVLGNQKNPYRWIAADDYAHMVATAYKKPEAKNKIFYCFGPQTFLMKDLLEKYCKELHPEVKKVSNLSLSIVRFIAFLSGKKQLKTVADLFSYFEKVKEMGSSEETDEILGKPEINFERWIALRKARE